MNQITEIFVLKLKDPERAVAIRERAKQDFLKLEGITSWRTFVTIAPDRPTLFAEVYTFVDEQAARRITPEFARREATKAYLDEVAEVIVGQYFVEIPRRNSAQDQGEDQGEDQ